MPVAEPVAVGVTVTVLSSVPDSISVSDSVVVPASEVVVGSPVVSTSVSVLVVGSTVDPSEVVS
jgi:hypothetical protein